MAMPLRMDTIKLCRLHLLLITAAYAEVSCPEGVPSGPAMLIITAGERVTRDAQAHNTLPTIVSLPLVPGPVKLGHSIRALAEKF